MSIIQNNHDVDSIITFQKVDKNVIKRTITKIYYKGYLIWELIVGFIFTHDKFAIKTKDGFMVKCKDQ